MNTDTLSIALTEFVRNLEACVFAFMQTNQPIEAEDFRIAKKKSKAGN